MGKLKSELNLDLTQNFRSTRDSHKRQITRVTDCGLERLGDLDFDLLAGSCTVSDDVMVLCFSLGNGKQCRRGSDPVGQFTKFEESEFNHERIHMSASEGNCFFFSILTHMCELGTHA